MEKPAALYDIGNKGGARIYDALNWQPTARTTWKTTDRELFVGGQSRVVWFHLAAFLLAGTATGTQEPAFTFAVSPPPRTPAHLQVSFPSEGFRAKEVKQCRSKARVTYYAMYLQLAPEPLFLCLRPGSAENLCQVQGGVLKGQGFTAALNSLLALASINIIKLVARLRCPVQPSTGGDRPMAR